MWWLLAREVLRLRGTISRDLPWEVMVDLYFHREVEEEKELDVSLVPEKPNLSLKESAQDREGEQANFITSEVGPTMTDEWNPTLPGPKMDWAAEHNPVPVQQADDWGGAGGQAW